MEWFSQRDRGPSPLVASARGREEKRRRLRGESAPCGNSGAVAAGGRRRWSLAVLSLPPVVAPTAWRGRLGETLAAGEEERDGGGSRGPHDTAAEPTALWVPSGAHQAAPLASLRCPFLSVLLAPALERGGSGNQSLSCKSLSDVMKRHGSRGESRRRAPNVAAHLRWRG